MKIQRTVSKNKRSGIEEFGRNKQNKNGTDNRKHDEKKRKRRKNPNNRTFQDVENSGQNYNKQKINENFEDDNLRDTVILLSKNLKQKLMKMIIGMTENNQIHKRRSLLPQA